jgi:CRP-like cAMP-binding protein
MREASQHPAIGNQLLAVLPSEELRHLKSEAEVVSLKKGEILCNTGDSVQHAYFISDGMLSLLSSTQDGSVIEVGMVGNEGMVGIPIVLGINTSPYQIMVQIEVSSAFKIRASKLRVEFNRGGRFQGLLLRYAHLVLTQVSQSAVCNRFHQTEERLARWLLIARDRLHSDTFTLTHEIISHMLGTPRTGVTMAAGALQKRGLITYSRGRITIINRKALETFSCECYESIKEEFDRFLATERASAASRN